MSDVLKAMKNSAVAAKKQAYSPYSHFSVGVCILAENGELYAGCNVENVSYGLTQCAEASAIGTMITNGAQKIKAVVIVSDAETFCYPCGACRQRLVEFSLPDTEIHLFNRIGDVKQHKLEVLLPFPFDKKFLDNA